MKKIKRKHGRRAEGIERWKKKKWGGVRRVVGGGGGGAHKRDFTHRESGDAEVATVLCSDWMSSRSDVPRSG